MSLGGHALARTWCSPIAQWSAMARRRSAQELGDSLSSSWHVSKYFRAAICFKSNDIIVWFSLTVYLSRYKNNLTVITVSRLRFRTGSATVCKIRTTKQWGWPSVWDCFTIYWCVLGYLQQLTHIVVYLTSYSKLYSVNSAVYIAKQCFAQLFPWYARDSPMVCCWSGRIPRVVFETVSSTSHS